LDDLRRRYPSVRFKFDGELDEEDAAIDSLIVAFSVSIILIYFLLAIPLKSYLKPLLIVSIVPFGYIGVVIGHLIFGIPISLLSFFGFLTLYGVVVNDSLILITTIYEDSNIDDIEVAVKSSVLKRFRAVVLTLFTTFARSIPIIFSTSYQVQLFAPTTLSLGFGIVFSTYITLILVSVICLIVDDVKGDFAQNK
jgi:multidrug efflux pump subunit AcrB